MELVVQSLASATGANSGILNFGKEHDLTDQIVLRRILSEIRKQRVLGVIMDPPLRTFSTARDRQHPIRDRLQPWGVHHSLLSKSETADIERDNQCLQACLRIIRELDRFRIPYLLAQPASSKVWWLPEVVAQQSKGFHRGCCRWHLPVRYQVA